MQQHFYRIISLSYLPKDGFRISKNKYVQQNLKLFYNLAPKPINNITSSMKMRKNVKRQTVARIHMAKINKKEYKKKNSRKQ